MYIRTGGVKMKKKQKKWHENIVLKPRFLKGYTYMDKCDSMVHYMFELLCQFVENESHQIMWYDTPKQLKEGIEYANSIKDKKIRKGILANIKEHQRVKKEMDFLYIWWTEARPAYIDKSPFGDKFDEEHPEYRMEDYFTTVGNNGKIIKQGKPVDKLYKERTKASLKDMNFDLWVQNTDKEMMKRLVDIKEYLWS